MGLPHALSWAIACTVILDLTNPSPPIGLYACRSVEIKNDVPSWGGVGLRPGMIEGGLFGWTRLRGGDEMEGPEDDNDEESTEHVDEWEKERLRNMYEQAAREFPDLDFKQEMEEEAEYEKNQTHIDDGAMIVVGSGYDDLEVVAIRSTLSQANVGTRTVALSSCLSVVGQHGTTIQADVALQDVPHALTYIGLVLPGGSKTFGAALATDQRVTALIRAYAERRRLLCALGTGVLALKGAGVLEGRRFAAPPSLAKELPNASPDAAAVADENFLTAQGGATSLECGLGIVEIFRGRAAAVAVAEALRYPRLDRRRSVLPRQLDDELQEELAVHFDQGSNASLVVPSRGAELKEVFAAIEKFRAAAGLDAGDEVPKRENAEQGERGWKAAPEAEALVEGNGPEEAREEPEGRDGDRRARAKRLRTDKDGEGAATTRELRAVKPRHSAANATEHGPANESQAALHSSPGQESSEKLQDEAETRQFVDKMVNAEATELKKRFGIEVHTYEDVVAEEEERGTSLLNPFASSRSLRVQTQIRSHRPQPPPGQEHTWN